MSDASPIKMKVFPVTADQEAFRQELLALASRFMVQNSALELLAIAAQAVGQLIACQDSSRYARSDVMDLVVENIERGNAAMVEALIAQSGGRN